MNQEIFDREIAMCRKLSQENNGHCNWGECEKCGVIPLLYKLNKVEFYENKQEIEKLKQTILN